MTQVGCNATSFSPFLLSFTSLLTGFAVGRVDLRTELDDGLTLQRQTCPIGVLLIIFEARPEVIANIASLAIKSANAAILKGGKESTESFKAISTVIASGLD